MPLVPMAMNMRADDHLRMHNYQSGLVGLGQQPQPQPTGAVASNITAASKAAEAAAALYTAVKPPKLPKVPVRQQPYTPPSGWFDFTTWKPYALIAGAALAVAVVVKATKRRSV